MATEQVPQVSFSALFCDDIRHEIGGQTTYVGSFQSELRVRSFPHRLPKFCAVLFLFFSHPNKADEIRVEVRDEEKVIFSFTPDLASRNDMDETKPLRLNMNMEAVGMVLESAGQISASATINSVVYHAANVLSIVEGEPRMSKVVIKHDVGPLGQVEPHKPDL